MKIQNFLSVIKNFLGIKQENSNIEESPVEQTVFQNNPETNQTQEIQNYIDDLLKYNQFTKLKEVIETGINLNSTQNNNLYRAFGNFLSYGGTGKFLKSLNNSEQFPVVASDISSLSLIPFTSTQIESTRKFFKTFSFQSRHLAIGGFAYFLDNEATLNSNVGLSFSDFPKETFELFTNMLAINHPEALKGMEKIIPKELFTEFLLSSYYHDYKKNIIKKIDKNHQLNLSLNFRSSEKEFMQSFFRELPVHHMVHSESFVKAYVTEYIKHSVFLQDESPLFKKQRFGISHRETSQITKYIDDKFSNELDQLFNEMSVSFNTHNDMMDKIKEQIKISRSANTTLEHFSSHISQTTLSENLKADLINAGKILNQMKELNTSDEIKHYTQQIFNQLLKTVDTSLQMKDLDLIDDTKVRELLSPIMSNIVEQFQTINQQFIDNLQQNNKKTIARNKP